MAIRRDVQSIPADGAGKSRDPLDEAHRVWIEHGWGAPDEMIAATSILRAQQIVVAKMDAVLRPWNLSYPRFELLVLLYVSRRGCLPLGKVSERLMIHPTSVTGLVDRLAQDELIVREPNPDDRRGVLAWITPNGRVVVEEVAPELGAVRFGLGSIDCRKITDAIRELRQISGDFE